MDFLKEPAKGSQRNLKWRLAAPSILLFLALLSPGSMATSAQTQNSQPSDVLGQASLEQLMNLEVTSASKKEQRLSEVAAAVFVITQEDIRRSGATTIPDLLRMVPGLEVAQINANTWAISARGFNNQFSNKLLVMIDGRTVYDPSFSGVYWDVQDVPLEDIERIEVIRGPGATIWGTNAVNGVINIITKSSKETQGGLITAGGGNTQQDGAIRYGDSIGKHATFRVFGKYFSHGGFKDFSGNEAGDGWMLRHSGFRIDWDPSKHDSLEFEGDIYDGHEGDPFPTGPSLLPPFFTSPATVVTDLAGGSVLARWEHTLQGGSKAALQVYFDRMVRASPIDPNMRNTFDIDFEHHLTLRSRHDIVWGFGYRSNVDALGGAFRVSFTPSRFKASIENSFIQDEITLVPDKIWLTAGTKVEHNEFSGVELEPSVRLLWAPNLRQSLWWAYAHAHRIPARSDRGLDVGLASFPTGGGLPAEVSLFGNPHFKPEVLNAFEFGYRYQPEKQLSLDFTAYLNDYNNLMSVESEPPYFLNSPQPPHLVIPEIFDNKMFGMTYGVEASVDWEATKQWKLVGGYTWFVPALRLRPSSNSMTFLQATEGQSPRNQIQLRSELDLPHRFEFDSSVDRVGRLATGGIPTYTRIDARLGWRWGQRAELSLVGRNLLDPRHPEFLGFTDEFVETEATRAVYGRVKFRF